MRAIRLGLFTVLLATISAPVRADVLDIDTLGPSQTSDPVETLIAKNENWSGGSQGSGHHRCGQHKSDRGRCSEDWQRRHADPAPPIHSVPEPGTLLLMGVGILAGGALSFTRNRRN